MARVLAPVFRDPILGQLDPNAPPDAPPCEPDPRTERGDTLALSRRLPPCVSGVLHKRGRLGRWSARYAELRGSAMVVYSKHQELQNAPSPADEPATFSISGCVVEPEPGRDSASKAKFAFSLTLPDQRLVLAAPTEADRATWVQAIRRNALLMRLSDFACLGALGVGGYGRVFRARHLGSGEHVALKCVGLKEESNIPIGHAVHERIALEVGSGHPFLGTMHGCFSEGGRLYYALPLGARDLFEFMRRRGTLTVSQARLVGAEVTSAVVFLHAHQILHRDIKIENVLLQKDGHVRLIDFGLSRVVDDWPHGMRGTVGTDHYMPPEMLAKRRYGGALDCWQIGCLLFVRVG